MAAELLARFIRRPAGAAGITEPPAALRAVSSVGTVGVAAGRAADHALSFHRGRRPRRIWLVPQGARRCQRRREGAVELAWGRSWAGSLVPAIWIPQAADATLGCMTAETIDTSHAPARPPRSPRRLLALRGALHVRARAPGPRRSRRLAPATRAAPGRGVRVAVCRQRGPRPEGGPGRVATLLGRCAQPGVVSSCDPAVAPATSGDDDRESGRPGSNRRRPAWEAFWALAGQGFFGGGSRIGITQYGCKEIGRASCRERV